ncbi:MAG: hypothetical protein E6J34_22085 [Chloroflexi bacterium]|nr:MAG: hypothetical protein E6J34_22085 [Chloroflexota bacterium]
MNMQSESIDYDWIKRVAKAQGVSVNEYIVLAPQNDPFYTGTPNDRALGQWFADVWQQLGEGRSHLRRVHYYLVSLGSVTFPNGKPYENTMECWEALNMASKAARYLQLVDPAAFNDRRTPEVMIYVSDAVPQPSSVSVSSPVYSLRMQLPEFPHLPHYAVDGFTAVQSYHLELWCEKSTMNDVFMPLCERYIVSIRRVSLLVFSMFLTLIQLVSRCLWLYRERLSTLYAHWAWIWISVCFQWS